VHGWALQNLMACTALVELNLSNNAVASLAQIGLCPGPLRRLVLRVRPDFPKPAHYLERRFMHRHQWWLLPGLLQYMHHLCEGMGSNSCQVC
jgi:hypothetical protein